MPMTTPGSARQERGDDPFLPEQELLWWLPRAGVVLAALLGVALVVVSFVHHRQVRLVEERGVVVLERGRLGPSGWTPWVPDGAVMAWRSVPWPDAPREPLTGDLSELSETFAGLLRARAQEPGADLARLAAQEDALGAWHRRRFDSLLPGDGTIAAILRSWQAPPLRGRAYQHSRRSLLQGAERLLDSISEDATADEERDRAALQRFIESMDTPPE